MDDTNEITTPINIPVNPEPEIQDETMDATAQLLERLSLMEKAIAESKKPVKKVVSEKQKLNLEKARATRQINMEKRKEIKKKLKDEAIVERKLINKMLKNENDPPVIMADDAKVVRPLATVPTLASQETVPETVPVAPVPRVEIAPQARPAYSFMKVGKKKK